MSGWLGLDWGNVPAWFGAIASGGGLIFTGRQVQLNTRQREEETRRLAEEAKRHRQRHGRRVNVWTRWGEAHERSVEMSITVENHGEDPIVSALPTLVIPPDFWRAGRLVDGEARRIQPGGSRTWGWAWATDAKPPRSYWQREAPMATVRFQDIEGYWWVRDPDGSLIEVPPPRQVDDRPV